MERITINPGDCEVFGNIIGNQKGYLQDVSSFQTHKCELELNPVKSDEWNSFDVFSFKLVPNEELVNCFSENLQYCKPASVNSLYVCEHFNQPSDSSSDFFNPITDFFDVSHFDYGYTLKVKESYLNSSNLDLTAPFYLLLLDNDAGVSIPSGASSVLFSTTYNASENISSILAGFVFFDKEGKLLETYNNPTTGVDISNEGSGNTGRIHISESIPSGAKYVGVEFQFPDGVGAVTVEGAVKYDYFSLRLNCLMFNQTYAGFIKN